ncbi:MAG: hypothetical protein NVSMB47_05380 [Polyangiales bacterium]
MHRSLPVFARRIVVLFVVLACALVWTRSASAYPWMIRTGQGPCATCHVDPSGSGILTAYGRVQGDMVLRDHYTANGKGSADGLSKTRGFLWGAVDLPAWLLLSGSYRGMLLDSRPPSPAPEIRRFVQMQADFKVAVRPGIFRASASLGYARGGALSAALTTRDRDNLVSREHWVGVALADDTMLLRAGRMGLPFGLRNIEHNSYVRAATRTDLNDAQQYGLALAYSDAKSRGEVMAIVGNLALHPDDYRERGYSALFEYFVDEHVGLGVSSLRAQALRDLKTRVSYVRQAHGVFVRASPWEPLVLLLEADALLLSPDSGTTSAGYTGMLQADFEVRQGLHVMLTGEVLRPPQPDARPSLGGWLTVDWFFFPHLDLRADAIQSRVAAGDANVSVTTFLLQLHAYL